jgi:hypothetical protein
MRLSSRAFVTDFQQKLWISPTIAPDEHNYLAREAQVRVQRGFVRSSPLNPTGAMGPGDSRPGPVRGGACAIAKQCRVVKDQRIGSRKIALLGVSPAI